MRAARIFAMGCVFATASATAAAQDTGRVGLTTGYPGSIGILWHISDRTAVRPEFSFTVNSSSSKSLIEASSDFWSLGPEVSVLFYSPLRDNLKLYVAPRFAYSRTSGTSDITQSTTNVYSIAGMFGGHYALGRRFAVFGEAGVQYSHQTGTLTSSLSPSIQTTNDGSSVGTRTGIGVVLYF